MEHATGFEFLSNVVGEVTVVWFLRWLKLVQQISPAVCAVRADTAGGARAAHDVGDPAVRCRIHARADARRSCRRPHHLAR